MEFVKFQPLPGSSAQVEGYLHLPSGDAQNRREAFPAVVVCPGGGYESISAHEADPVALDFLAHGCQAFVLTYSIGEEAKDFRPCGSSPKRCGSCGKTPPSGSWTPKGSPCAAFPPAGTWPLLWAPSGMLRSFYRSMTATAVKTGPTP